MPFARWSAAPALGAVLLTLAAGSLSGQRIKLPTSLKHLEEAAKQDSNDAAAHFNVALAFWNEKRWDDAQAALSTALSIEPQFASAHLALAYLPYAQRPRLFTEQAERRVPDEWKPAIEEADRRYRQAFLLDPLCDLRITGAAVPTSSLALGPGAGFIVEFFFDYVQGFKALLEGDYEKAYVGFQRVVNLIDGERHPKRIAPALHWWRGMAAAHAGRWDAAEWDLERLLDADREREEDEAIEIFPLQTNEYRYVLAVFKHRAGKLDEARQLYQEALEQDVGLYMANAQLARIHEVAGEWDLAIRERQAAVNANPGDPSLLYDLGLTYARGGRWIDAELALTQALDGNGRDTRILYYLGTVRSELGKPAEARQAFERFVTLAPSRYANQVADAKRRLDALR
jgi:tetratricopeptide (TPR) repeat protein